MEMAIEDGEMEATGDRRGGTGTGVVLYIYSYVDELVPCFVLRTSDLGPQVTLVLPTRASDLGFNT